MPRSSGSSSPNDSLSVAIDSSNSKKSSSGVTGMLWIFLGATMTAIMGLGLARRSSLKYALDWSLLQVKYNVVAMKEVFQDHLHARYNKTELPLMPGRIAVVTGGSRGIGVEIVHMLLQCDMEVIIACRNTSAGEKTVQKIRDSGVKTGKARVMELNNSSFESIRKFADEFKRNYNKLDILINNAGIMFTPYRETKDGFEEQYGVNYLSHFLLTMLLIPLLKNAGTSERCSRIVNVSSCAHLLGSINFDDINHKKYFLTGEAYAQSKLAQVLFTKSLTRLFTEKKLPIKVHAVHPGVVNTDLFDVSYLKYFRGIGYFIFKNAKQGAVPITFAAVSPKIEDKSGLYINNCLEAPINPLADDEALQDRLFELSLKQVHLQNVTT